MQTENYFLSTSYLSEIGVTGQKNDFFGFFSCCTSTHRDETYCFHQKIHIFSLLEIPWGEAKNVNFRLKITPQAEKNTFFGFFFSCCTSTHQVKTFYFIKISYIQPFRDFMGGGQKSVTTNNNKQQMSTTDDHNTRHDLKDPRANNDSFLFMFLPKSEVMQRNAKKR